MPTEAGSGLAGWLVLTTRFAQIDNRNLAPACQSVSVGRTSACPEDIEVPPLQESRVRSDAAFTADVHVLCLCAHVLELFRDRPARVAV